MDTIWKIQPAERALERALDAYNKTTQVEYYGNSGKEKKEKLTLK